MKYQNKNLDNLDLHSEKLENALGKIPLSILNGGLIIISIILIIFITIMILIPYPYSEGESILIHIINHM